MKRIHFLILIMLLCLGFLPQTSYAQTDNSFTLGRVAPNLLEIRINSNGNYCVSRWMADTNGVFAWRRQFYANNSHLFAIKIGDTVYRSVKNDYYPTAGTPIDTNVISKTYFQIADVGTAVTTGVHQEMTKKFTGTYINSNISYPFSVTIKITYDTTSPDYFIKHASIDASNIPAGTPIIFAYGWDTYVNISDKGYAYIVPDIFTLNNNPTEVNRYLTTAQVRSLHMVGASNNTGAGAVIAFFPIGRNFDRAYSANHYNPAYCFNMPLLTPGNGTSSGNDMQYKFQFGPFIYGLDNGTGVGYDSIPAGQITEIKTGLTFTSSLDGDLDYYWNGLKNCTVAAGTSVNLNLNYLNYSLSALNNVGFRVNFQGLHVGASCSLSGFTGGTSTCAVGNQYYQLSGATVAASANASVTVPVNTSAAGVWVIDGNTISNTTQTLPLGSQATLMVTTTASLSNNTPANVCKGDSKQFTVGFPAGITASDNVTINLSYSGATSSFTSMPSSVTILAGQSSVNFTVTALPTGKNNDILDIVLSSTNADYVTIASPSSVQFIIGGNIIPTINIQATPK